MANIKLKGLLKEAEDFKARSKETGKLVHFKSKDSYDAALKAGTHEDPKDKKDKDSKVSTKPNDMFGGDYAKDRGGEAPKADMGVDKVVYNKRTKTVGIVRMADERGETKTDADGNVNTSELEPYNPMKYPHQKDAKVAPSTQKEVDARGLWNPFAQTQASPKGEQPKAAAKSNSMFGADYAKDRSAKTAPKADPVIAVASRAQMVPKAVAGWADKNGVDLSKVSDDLNSGKLNVFDFMTAVSGIPGNKYAKDIIAKYSQSDSNTNYSQSVKQDEPEDGQTDDELYDALYDMGYDFGELGSDDFDEEGFADAAMSLGYRYDDKNKVWNHRDVEDSGSTKSSSQLPNKASKLNYKHAEVLEKSVNAETGLNGYVDTDENTDAIMYNASKGMSPTYTLYFGGNSDYNKPDEFRVSLLPTYGNDPAKLGDKIDKTFQNGDDAMKFMVAVAKKYKKELEMDDDTNESTKLTSMIKR